MNERNVDIKEEFMSLSELIKQPQRNLQNIDQLLNKQFVITKIEIYNGQFGEFAVVETDLGSYRTSSKVLVKQLKVIQTAMIERKLKGVKVTLTKRKSANKRSYYTFE
jgi:hypothetical protein